MNKTTLSLLLLLLASQSAYSQDPSDTDQNPYRSPKTAENSPTFKFEWTAEKYLIAVGLVDRHYASEENVFSDSGTQKLEILLSLKVHYMAGTAPRADFSPENIMHLAELGGYSSALKKQVIATAKTRLGDSWPKYTIEIWQLVLELERTNRRPVLSESAIETIFVGLPPQRLKGIHDELTNPVWRPLANRAAVEFSTAAVYMFEGEANRLNHLVNRTMIFGTLGTLATMAGSIVLASSFPELFGKSPATWAFLAGVTETIGFMSFGFFLERKQFASQDNATIYRDELAQALKVAKRNNYHWKNGIKIPNIVHLQTCNL